MLVMLILFLLLWLNDSLLIYFMLLAFFWVLFDLLVFFIELYLISYLFIIIFYHRFDVHSTDHNNWCYSTIFWCSIFFGIQRLALFLIVRLFSLLLCKYIHTRSNHRQLLLLLTLTNIKLGHSHLTSLCQLCWLYFLFRNNLSLIGFFLLLLLYLFYSLFWYIVNLRRLVG